MLDRFLIILELIIYFFIGFSIGLFSNTILFRKIKINRKKHRIVRYICASLVGPVLFTLNPTLFREYLPFVMAILGVFWASGDLERFLKKKKNDEEAKNGQDIKDEN